MASTDSSTNQSVNESERLLRQMVVIAFVSMLAATLLSSYGFYRIFSGFVIKSAENDSLRLCRVMIDQQKPLLFDATSSHSIGLVVHESDIAPLDRNLRHFLRPFGIVKIKIYDTDSRIIYSTESKLIGKKDEANARLRSALSGTSDAMLVTKDKVHDLAEEQLLDVDVVETYVPITGEAGKVLGCFEIYVNVTHYRDQIRHVVVVTSSLLVLVLAALFGCTYLLVRRSLNQLTQAQAELETLAHTDPLTTVANRGYLMLRGEEEFERIRRNHLKNQPLVHLGCIMLDLDHFKRFNDTRGYLTGDQLLRGIAQRVKNCVRSYDVVGRYGGDEFVVLLPDANLEQALVVAERIRNTICRIPIEIMDEEVTMTISLGVSCSNENDQELSDLLKRSDEGLYKAKAAGMNRVAWVYHPFDSEIHS
jgi:diguanylate cyclase (GGDEF)-like protein